MKQINPKGYTTFKVSDNVILYGVTFKNQYNMKVAGHVDLYDKTDLIPFDKLTSFFTQYLQEAAPKEKGSMVIGANK